MEREASPRRREGAGDKETLPEIDLERERTAERVTRCEERVVAGMPKAERSVGRRQGHAALRVYPGERNINRRKLARYNAYPI